jgi:seryl-tRNA(Sec) selenium transferase
MVEIGYGHHTIPYQLDAAFTERAAMVFYVQSPWAGRGVLSLPETCEIAHRHGVPVLVDAAAMLPPISNLTSYIAEGADLVAYSGGKGLHGPQSSGILAGRADLIAAARRNGSPNHSIGRPAKAAKEDIVGLMVAIQLYLERDHEADMAGWRGQAEYMIDRLQGVPGIGTALKLDGDEHLTPRVEITFDAATGVNAAELIAALEEGDPRVFLFEPNGPTAKPNSIIIHCHTMQAGEEEVVAEVVRTAILKRLPVHVTEVAVTD